MSAALVRALDRVAVTYGPEARAEKRRLILVLAGRRLRSARALLRYHEVLCFLQAYPDDAAVLAAVDRELVSFHRRTATKYAGLRDTGVAGTTLAYPFGFPMARWLSRSFPGDADVSWAGFTRGDDLDETLALVIGPPESDALGEGGPGWRRWLRELAKGGRRGTDLEVLVERFEHAAMDEAVRDRLFESLGLHVSWRLAHGSRTTAKLADARVVFQQRALSRRLSAFVAAVLEPVALHRPPVREARILLDAFRLALATRLREVYAVSYSNARDVWVADVERGLRVMLVGVRAQHRLPIESLYAFLLLKNGVPIGYGTGTAFFEAIEIAFNIFPAFRPGESAWTFSQVLRVFRSALGATEFVADPYQFGLDNEEALRSGAFYFYHRLGFRSRNPAVRRLLRGELARIARTPGYRSPLGVLKQLAVDELSLRLPGALRGPRVRAHRLGVRLTERIAREFGGDADRARRDAERRVAGAIGGRPGKGFGMLAPILALIPDLERWLIRERRTLAAIVATRDRADSETPYARALRAHRRLHRALAALCG